MEENNLPPVISDSSMDESNSLEGADAQATVASFSSSPQHYPIETLEVKNEGEKAEPQKIVASVHSTAFSKRKAILISLGITLLVIALTGAALAYFIRSNSSGGEELSERNIPVQSVEIGEKEGQEALSMFGEDESLLVNGDIAIRGTIKISDGEFATILGVEQLSQDNQFLLPNASGTFCLDSNNCGYASEGQLDGQQNQINALQNQIIATQAQLQGITIPDIPDFDPGVVTLNGQEGAVSIQGATSRVNITTSNGVIRITTPQDIATSSSPTFSNLILSGSLSVSGSITIPLNCSTYLNGGSLTTNSSGQIICSDDDGGTSGVSTPGGTPGAIAMFTGGNSIDDSIISQLGSTVSISGSLALSNALSVGSGGTGIASTPMNGQLLIGNGVGYDLATLAQGSGITISRGSGALTIATTLGNSITSPEIVDGTILAVDLSTTNTPNDDFVLTYDQASGGFTWASPSSVGGGSVSSLNDLSGALLLQSTSPDLAIVDNGSNTISLALGSNVSLLGQSIGSSEIEANAVQLGSQTTGNYVSAIGSLTGLSTTGNSGEGSTPSLAVLYGATAGTAVQGNTVVTCAAGVGNLSGGGNSITLGAGGSCNDISIVNNPNFSVSVTTPQITSINGLNIDSGAGIDIFSTTDTAITASNDLDLNSLSGTVNINSTAIFSDGVAIQGQDLIIGQQGNTAGVITLYNSSNSNYVSLQSGATSSSYSLTLPTSTGSVNQCLKSQDGSGTLFWDDCLGGSGGGAGIASILGQTGPAITIDNATGSGNVITIDNAAADGSSKGIAAFDSSNFTSTNGVINTIQNINTTAAPEFAGLTLTGNVNLGNNTLQGTGAAIEFANFEVASSGNTTIAGTLGVSGLTTLSGGLTLSPGGVFTLNGDALTDLTGSGLSVSSNALSVSVQANKGLEVDSNGLSLIDCNVDQILKYNGSGQWVCATDAGGSGVGDNVFVNGSAANDINLLDTAATGSEASISWSLDSLSTPDSVTLSIGSASATEAGIVTTGSQIFAGDKTFNDQITASGGIGLGNSILQGTNATIDFTNFEVSSTGAVTAVGIDAGTGLLQGTGGLSVGGSVTLSSLANGFLEVDGSGVVSVGTIDLGTDTAGDYMASLGSLTGLFTTGNSGEGSTPSLAVLYGSTANTSVQGNTTITCAAGAGNLTGGGNSITLGAGGSCSDISIVNNPNFSVSVTTPLVQGNGEISIESGSGASLTMYEDSTIHLQSTYGVYMDTPILQIGNFGLGGVLQINDGSSNIGSIQAPNLSSNRTYMLPDADGTICLTSGNCIGGSSGAAPADASYLTLSTNGNLSNERALTLGSNLTSTDGGANGNFTIGTVHNPTFGTSVTTPILQSAGGLAISNSGAGNDITITSTDQIIMNAADTIELKNDTNVTGDIAATGSLHVGSTARIGNFTDVVSNIALLVSNQFDSSSNCVMCTGIYSLAVVADSSTVDIMNAIVTSAEVLSGQSVEELVGIRVLWNGGSGGTVQDNYGIYVHHQDVGVDSNYGVYIEGASTHALHVASGASYLNGELTVTGQSTFGTVSSAGSLQVHDGNGSTGTLQTASLTGDRTYLLPDADGTICLTSGNCIGGENGAAPANASYLVVGGSGLTNERIFTLNSNSNLSISDGGAGGNFSIGTVTNPTFGTSVTTPLLRSQAALNITSFGAGNDITITSADQIILNSSGTIELQDNTNVTGNLDVSRLLSVGNTASPHSRHIISVSHTFDANNTCDEGICSGVDSIVTVGSSTPSPNHVSAFSGAIYANAGTVLPMAAGILINTGGGSGTIQTNTGIHIAQQTAGTLENYGLYIAGASTHSIHVASGSTYLNGALTVTGQSTFGTTSSAGSLRVFDGSSHTGTIQTTNLSSNRTYTLPDADGTICLTSGNCIGGENGAAPANASYLLLGTSPNLTSERVLTLGENLTSTDGGANGNFTIDTVNSPIFNSVSTDYISGKSGNALAINSLLGAINVSAFGGAFGVTTTGVGYDITLNSADQIILNAGSTIELQDETNVSGDFAVDANTFNVNTTDKTIGLGIAAGSDEILSMQGSDDKIEIYSAGDSDFELASDGAVYISIDNDNSDSSGDDAPAFNIVSNGNYSDPVVWISQNGDIETKGSIFLESFLTLGVDALSISSNGSGTPASYTLEPLSSYVEITCNDPQGCNITMDDSSPEEGDTLIIMNAGSNTIQFSDTPGVQELAGDFSIANGGIGGQYDTLSMIFVGDRWVETSRSNN